MTRRCSHCSNNGHNSRTCPNRGVKIFGVRLTDGSIRKSASMGNLTLYAGATGGASPAADGTPEHGGADGYASEDLGQGSNAAGRERKKGVPWTEEEHRMFLLGLKKLGKGDWRGIARNYVVSRTPTQVASHAQKYFIRQTNMSRRKRRTSLFDMVPVEQPLDAQLLHVSSQDEIHDNALPAPPALEEECESMDSNSNDEGVAIPKPLEILPPPPPSSYPVLYPTAVAPPFYPYAFQFWPAYSGETSQPKPHEVVKPTAIHQTAPVNVDELGSMSRLSLADSISDVRPSFLSLKLPDGSDRHSAFHANPSASRVNSGSSAIPAV